MADKQDDYLSSKPAAAMSSQSEGDLTLAKKLSVLEQLTSVLGFDPNVAHQAVDAVGFDDITVCYNYILDQKLAEDTGGPIVPIETCPHVADHVKITFGKLPLMPGATRCKHTSVAPLSSTTPRSKEEKEENGQCPGSENWLCLECGTIGCSRYVNGHGLEHWQDTKADSTVGHCVAVSLSDLSVWCYVCQAYVQNPSLMPITRELEQRKQEEDVVIDMGVPSATSE